MNSARAKLKKWRVDNCLSGRALSRLLGAADNAVSRIETGQRLPGRDMAIKIHETTGIDPAEWNKTASSNPDKRSVKKKSRLKQ